MFFILFTAFLGWSHAHPVLLLALARRCALTARLGLEDVLDPSYPVLVRNVHCGGCGLYLGVQIMQVGEHRAGEEVKYVR